MSSIVEVGEVVPIKQETPEAMEAGEVKDKEVGNESESENDDDECPIPNSLEYQPPKITLSVGRAPPVVLKTKKTCSQRQPKRSQGKLTISRPTTRKQFMEEMRTKIIASIDEAKALGLNPREYHPFYLEVQKHISLGQRLGFIGIEKEDVHKIWVKYNDLLRKEQVMKLEGQELSPYALYIQKGKVYSRNGDLLEIKRDEEELRWRFDELEDVVERISSNWRKKGIQNAKDDLEARLEFLNECRTMSHPADVIRMNDLWKRFNNKCRRKSIVFSISSDDDVPPDFQCRVEMEDISKDRKWGSKVRRLLLKRKRATLEVSSPPPVKRVKIRAMRINKEGSKSKKPEPKKRTQAALESSKPHPLEWTRMKHVSKNTTKSNSTTVKNGSRSQRKPGANKRKRKKSKAIPVRLTSEERAKQKLRERRLKKFMCSRQQRKWDLRLTCRRRRRWELERVRRSAKVQLTLEKVISGCWRLHTIETRKKRLNPKGKKKYTKRHSYLQSLSCLYCDFTCKKRDAAATHMSRVHPEKPNNFKEEKIKSPEVRRRKAKEARARWKKFSETGDGPQWMWKKFVKGPKRPNSSARDSESLLCDVCGAKFCDVKNVNIHKAYVHNSEKTWSKCPFCPDTYRHGTHLWLHFLSKHMLHDITNISQAKGDKIGIGSTKGLPLPISCKPEKVKIKDLVSKAPDGSDQYACDICWKTFEVVDVVMRHKKYVHGVGKDKDEDWQCDICMKPFKSKDSRDAHIKQIHEGQDYRCDICNRKTQTAGKLWRHKVEFHQMHGLEPPEGLNVSQCPYCGEQMLRGLNAHVKKAHPEKITEFLESRKKEKKKKKKKPRGEKEREKGILQKREIRRKWREEGIAEEAWVAKSAPKKCPHCHIDTKDIKQATWPDHLADEHGIIVDERKWICPVDGCKERFFSLDIKMKRHVMRHSRLYALLRQNNYVREEVSPEDGLKMYYCCECGRNGEEEKAFVSEGEVRIHFLVIHTKIYNQFRGGFDPECKESGKGVLPRLTTDSLATSADIPIPEVPVDTIELKKYSCPHCSVEVFSDFDLRCHVEVTHESECWRCPISNCSKVLLSSDELNEHFKKDHKDGWV